MIFMALNTFKYNIFDQSCQMVYFETKNSNLGIFWRALDWKILLNFIAVWCLYFMSIRYFISFWVYCIKKNLATLFLTIILR
jgi:hypothetical protein